MINNIRLKIIAGKINIIPELYTIFARKMPDYIIRQQDRGQVEAKCLKPRPRSRPKFEAEARPNLWGRGQNVWPRGHFGL